jgi:hypothetical protein
VGERLSAADCARAPPPATHSPLAPGPSPVVGVSVRGLRLAHALAPRMVERAAKWTVERGLLRREPAESAPGNLHESSAEWASADGGFNRGAGHRAAPRIRRAVAAGASVLGPGSLTWAMLRKGKDRRGDRA